MNKSTFFTIVLIFLASVLIAQVPQSINYQAVARDNSGEIVKSSNIGLRFTIMQGSAYGTTVYRETHQLASDANGIINLKLGEGNAQTGTFSEINWGDGSMFLKTEMDVSGGTSYTSMGTTEMVSVPYSLYTGSIYVNYSNDTLYIGDQWVYMPGGGSTGGGDVVTDYDGNEYSKVTIGTQTWLGQNLRSAHYSDGTAISGAYDYNNSASEVYGKLYTWEAAMRGASPSSSSPSGVQGVCPEGYHLPSIDEWQTLKDYVSATYEVGGSLIGYKLKESGTSHWDTDNGTNETGFTAVGSGQMYMQSGEPQFQYIKEGGNCWSTTELSSNQDQAMWLKFYDSGIITTNTGTNKTNGLAVRCLKD